ncbi:UDP-glucuronate 4-epimerase [Sulfitobacter undariae]|uniref:UDP-glucuronate 4-epimerase n=1 Tax=Sulfitobacter undariae TaxID=1563671 RepID=A0A7W6E891_9RHOB|nr:SDR family NAD(P)-dependent oxidoreductase [Sulfitobacter undariae]MBB3996024.1 UDP-glucuronate 4-epimerase [Sulfitobacter undariae]
MPTALVTGAAGFIGYHVCEQLISNGYDVVGLDAMTDYYEVSLKEARHARLESEKFTFIKGYVEERDLLMGLFETHKFDLVIHLAAQAGVRYSIDNPRSYLESNIGGTFELLEAARAYPPRHMLLASTSSAYGANTVMPYVENVRADHQMSFYAATKKATEAMAHSYAHLYDLPITMFRFFTVYGPWGRPDMALFKFTKAILEGGSIDVYNNGDMSRDFTYIGDLVSALIRLIDVLPERGSAPAGETDSLSPVAPFRVLNIGNSSPTLLMDFISAIELATERKATCNMMPMQAGDVPATWADATLLTQLVGEIPHTKVPEGVAKFVNWYRDYYKC